MTDNYDFTLDYAPSAVQHLGVGLYKQLPQAVTELITNCWDADASKVTVDINYQERTISISDNGNGMTLDELNVDFLRVARNRRISDRSGLSPKGRKVTGKKGLGKLALFGIANRIQVYSTKNGLKNGFEMSFNVIQDTSDDQKYHPKSLLINQSTNEQHGTTIIINDLTLNKITPIDDLATSLARRFDKYSKSNFYVTIKDEAGNIKALDESSFVKSIKPSKIEFSYIFPDNFTDDINNNTSLKELQNRGITGEIFTKPTPLNANQQGFSILSRGKLASEHSTTQFAPRANDRFYLYSTGYFDIDFIDDDLKNDYISTDRQSILWNSSEDLIQLRNNLNKLIGVTQRKWRDDRKKVKEQKQKKILNSTDTVKQVLSSPNITKTDRQAINEISSVLEDDNISMPENEKSAILSNFAKSTDAYKRDNSVYKELIPKNFVVPRTVDSKIRRLREETISAATSIDDPDRFILTQGLLLRGILDTTLSTVIIKNLNEFHKLKILNSHFSKPKQVYDMKLRDKFYRAMEFLDKKEQLSSSKSASVIKNEFGNLMVTNKLDQLMHTPGEWPKFNDLKQMWDLLSPVLMNLFNFIKNE